MSNATPSATSDATYSHYHVELTTDSDPDLTRGQFKVFDDLADAFSYLAEDLDDTAKIDDLDFEGQAAAKVLGNFLVRQRNQFILPLRFSLDGFHYSVTECTECALLHSTGQRFGRFSQES